jgi:hypothetical protein
MIEVQVVLRCIITIERYARVPQRHELFAECDVAEDELCLAMLILLWKSVASNEPGCRRQRDD